MRLTPNVKLAILCGLVAIPTAIVAWSKLTSDERSLRDYDETPSSLVGLDDDDGADALQRYARDQQRLRATKMAQVDKDAVQAKTRAAMLAQLFADGSPGTPGLSFRELLADRPWSADPALRRRFDSFIADTGADVSVEDEEIVITLATTRGTYTDALRDAAIAAWQPADQDRWLDAANHLRASITTSFDGSSLRWQRTIAVAELFPPDPSTASALYPALGDAISAPPPLGTPTSSDADGYAYTLPPIAWSKLDVVVEVAVVDHAVAAVHVHTGAVTDAEINAVRAALRVRYGTPKKTGSGIDAHWRAGKLAIASTFSSGALAVELTRVP